MKRKLFYFFAVALVALLVFNLVGCGGQEEPVAEEIEEEETEPVEGDHAISLATVMPGSIQDADYNMLGYAAIQKIEGMFQDIQIGYSERVAVPDVKRVMQEYIDAGFDAIWVHGSQFNSAAFELAEEFPEVSFIVEIDIAPEERSPNVWYLDRNFYTGFYVLGALAATVTETSNIGYIGGLETPFSRGELNAIIQAINDLEADVKLHYVYVGDFNDPLGTRQSAEGLIAEECDVIISSVNEGNFGLFNAVEETDKNVFITTKYTDKSSHAPDNYLTTDGFDFSHPISTVVERIISGEKGGLLELKYGMEGEAARYTIFPILNVGDEVNDLIKQIAQDVADGTIEVIKEMDEVMPH
ncbi:MAG: BMP family ABC transporter substrate-binding protein [Firmicutes bacterium]|nr:BMP family ABC transporter substrate-binding protein [Bacillota bacterium]